MNGLGTQSFAVIKDSCLKVICVDMIADKNPIFKIEEPYQYAKDLVYEI